MSVRRLMVCALAVAMAGCSGYQEPLPRRDRINFPVGAALHPNARYLYVVNSNFDTTYDEDLGGTVAVIDTDTLEVLGTGSPFIPSFGGEIALSPDATRAYVAARRGNSLVALDVAPSGSALGCGQEQGGAWSLRSDTTDCVVRALGEEDGAAVVPADPFGVNVTRVERGGNPFDLVSTSHLRGDRVATMSLRASRSAIDLGGGVGDGQVSAISAIASATLASAPLLEGSNAVTQRPGTLEMYAAGKNTNTIGVFVPFVNDLGEAEAIVRRGYVNLNNLSSVVDARALTFDPAGERMFVVTRRPDALHVFRIVPEDPETGAGVDHQLERVVPLGDQPADVVLHRSPSGRDLLYVTCYDSQSIQVIDPDTGVLVDEIDLDAQPYTLVIDQDTLRCRFSGDRCRAYVTLFSDAKSSSQSCDDSDDGCGAVGVIDLDPASPRYHQLIAKVR